MTEDNWSPGQQTAISRVEEWLDTPGSASVFRLYGYAGTGKTTLARHLIKNVKGRVSVGAYTGKASMVLRNKGLSQARTLHSLLYRPKKNRRTGKSEFVLDEESVLKNSKLLVVDEASMLPDHMAKEILTFKNLKLLAMGDPGQLPPVMGNGSFFYEDPDVMLEEIHRQAADNPIIALSQAIREFEDWTQHEDGDRVILKERGVDDIQDIVLEADQVLVGTNASRARFNDRIRVLKGYADKSEFFPLKGEKLVCLKNNNNTNLMNGSTWELIERKRFDKGWQRYAIKSLDDGETIKHAEIHDNYWYPDGHSSQIKMQKRDHAMSDKFDFGYALTVHKSQGSQWNNVVLFDESVAFQRAATQWLYTGVTRAAERLTIVHR